MSSDRRKKSAEPRNKTRAGSNRAPFTSLREWLAHLAATGRLAVARPQISLRHELAAISKRLDGERATLFPKPDGHAVPVVSGLV